MLSLPFRRLMPERPLSEELDPDRPLDDPDEPDLDELEPERPLDESEELEPERLTSDEELEPERLTSGLEPERLLPEPDDEPERLLSEDEPERLLPERLLPERLISDDELLLERPAPMFEPGPEPPGEFFDDVERPFEDELFGDELFDDELIDEAPRELLLDESGPDVRPLPGLFFLLLFGIVVKIKLCLNTRPWRCCYCCNVLEQAADRGHPLMTVIIDDWFSGQLQLPYPIAFSRLSESIMRQLVLRRKAYHLYA